jgi:hypothetical protein
MNDADNLDRAADYAEKEREWAIQRRADPALNPGSPGECDFCLEMSERLVGGACVKCRNILEQRKNRLNPHYKK